MPEHYLSSSEETSSKLWLDYHLMKIRITSGVIDPFDFSSSLFMTFIKNLLRKEFPVLILR